MFRQLFRMSFYAVAKGRQVGIFRTWDECQSHVKNFSGAVFKKFKTNREAQEFIDEKNGNPATKKSLEPPAAKKSRQLTEEEEIEDLRNFISQELEEDETKPQSSSANKRKSNKKIEYERPKETTLKLYSGHYLHEDSDGYVHVYTDGSCENIGTKNAIAGLGVYYGKDHVLNVSEPVTGRPTNNVGEIQAAIRAIEDTQKLGVKRLHIFTDSQFLINSVCLWMKGWKRRGWTLAKGAPVINQVDFKRLDSLIENNDMLIKWSYIPAHRGYAGNEDADKLAKEGARKNRKVF